MDCQIPRDILHCFFTTRTCRDPRRQRKRKAELCSWSRGSESISGTLRISLSTDFSTSEEKKRRKEDRIDTRAVLQGIVHMVVCTSVHTLRCLSIYIQPDSVIIEGLLLDFRSDLVFSTGTLFSDLIDKEEQRESSPDLLAVQALGFSRTGFVRR